eukprot:TRINITY_DN2071_c0_g4_i1.p2 TRINITY_DN2071_c0_g4~~TRINITY_DN2071_c0_g4_i1.p2  ORF type:complete len:316 (+),score=91.24 TRINITY_DN2071_c0_g4_i1:95-949(+)
MLAIGRAAVRRGAGVLAAAARVPQQQPRRATERQRRCLLCPTRELLAVVPAKMPEVGEGIKQVELLSLAVKAGQTISEGDKLCEVQSDKATVEVPAPLSGKVVSVKAEVGAMVDVGSVIVEIDAEGSAAPAAPAAEAPASPPAAAPAASAPSPPAAGARKPMIRFTNGDRKAIDATLPWLSGTAPAPASGSAPSPAAAPAAPAAAPAAPAATNQLGGPRRWTIALARGAAVRAELSEGSASVGTVPADTDAEVVEFRGASARIVSPLGGWVTVGLNARVTLRGW